MYETIRYAVESPVATITLNRPDRLNALTPRMLAELRQAIEQADADELVVGIILTGAGRGFCAGADIERLKGLTVNGSGEEWEMGTDRPDTTAKIRPEFQLGLLYLIGARKPVIAAVNGPCAGLGFVLAMTCDLRFASQNARFTTAFANRGLIAEHGVSWILPRLVGSAHALDLLWSGRLVDSDEAGRIGLVNRVVPADRLLDEAVGYIGMLAERSAPTSIEIIKQQVYAHLSIDLAEATRESLRLMAESLKRPDFREGVASYVERRAPNFARVGADTPRRDGE